MSNFIYFRIGTKQSTRFVRTENFDSEFKQMTADARSYPFWIFDANANAPSSMAAVNMGMLKRLNQADAQAIDAQWID